MWSQGYWATKGKSIDYAFILEAGTYTVATGYHEWWSGDRKTKITVSANGETLASSEEFAVAGSKSLQENVDFTLAENAKVTVSITGNGADPILSWIGLIQNTKTGEFAAVDTKELEELIGNAEKVEKGSYTDASWTKFQEALKKAKETQKYVLSTADDIAAVNAELADAMAALQTPKEYLQSTIDQIAISDTNEGNYEKDAMWEYYEQVLASAKELLNKG